MQQFVFFVLGDVLYLPLTNSDCLSKRIQLIWTLSVHDLSCCVSGDLRGAFSCCSLKVVCLSQVVVLNMEGAKNKSS